MDENESSPPDAQSQELWYYEPELREVPKDVEELLEQYSQIAPSEAKQHITEVRDRAWKIHAYPCIGRFRFLSLNLPTLPQYPSLVARLREGAKLLDLGCCFGQELRPLVHAGVPAGNLYGVDLRPEFFDVGYDLFRDRASFDATLVAADVFADPAAPAFEALKGRMDIVYTGSFFHLFDRPQQVDIAKLVGALLKPGSGGTVLGRQVGDRTPGTKSVRPSDGGSVFWHDPHTWQEVWEEAGREMGIKWHVEAELVDFQRPGPEGRTTMSYLHYVVKKV